MKLSGKVAVVTGAGRGLGRAYALRLASIGADVAIIDRDLNSAAEFNEPLSAASVEEEVANQGRRAFSVSADLGDRHAAENAVDAILSKLGRIDILVNNAGGAFTPTQQSLPSIIPDEDIDAAFITNYKSTVHMCQLVVPAMKKLRGGAIVNTSSAAALRVRETPILSAYGAAKAAVASYTRYLAAEVGPFGIRVNCIAPAVTQTARIVAQANARNIGTDTEARKVPLRRLGTPDDCAGVIEFLVTDLSGFVTGQCISVCGGAVLTPS